MTTKQTQHTPGPWNFLTARNGDCGLVADGTGILAEVYAEIRRPGEDAREEAIANANLISAAPDMLAACKQMAADSRMVSGEPLLLQLRAAIAKAEGATI